MFRFDRTGPVAFVGFEFETEAIDFDSGAVGVIRPGDPRAVAVGKMGHVPVEYFRENVGDFFRIVHGD